MKLICITWICLLVNVLYLSCSPEPISYSNTKDFEKAITLPKPTHEGTASVEEAISRRKSVRQYSSRAITTEEISQILWSAQGTGVDGTTGATRAAPSAGATYPVEVFVVTGEPGEDEEIPAGIYHFDPKNHALLPVVKGDKRDALSQAALGQGFVAQAPVSIVLTVEYKRTTNRYGERGHRYVHMEIGHITQNIHLQAVALGLDSVAVGAFDDKNVTAILSTTYEPLMIIPIGHR